MVQKRHDVPLSLGGLSAVHFPLGNEDRLLKGARRACEELVLRACLPVVVTQDIEQAPCRGPALGEVVGPRGVHLQLPEMAILLGGETVVNAGELAVGALIRARRGHAGIGRRLRIELPSDRARDELARRPGRDRRVGAAVVRGPPEEDVAVGNGEVADDVTGFVLISAGDVAVEACSWLASSQIWMTKHTYHCQL